MAERTNGIETEEQARDRILLALLPHVAFDGWSRRALRMAAADAEMSEEELGTLMPRGVDDAMAQFADWADRQMLAALAEAEVDGTLAALRFRDRVAFAVMARLDALAPWREAARRALAVTAATRPTAPPLGAWRSADRIWRALGDRSADFNWYSKRGLLAGVLGASFLYWLDDDSGTDERTRAFVGRRLDAVIRIGGAGGRVMRGIGGLLEQPFRIAGRIADRLRPAS